MQSGRTYGFCILTECATLVAWSWSRYVGWRIIVEARGRECPQAQRTRWILDASGWLECSSHTGHHISEQLSSNQVAGVAGTSEAEV